MAVVPEIVVHVSPVTIEPDDVIVVKIDVRSARGHEQEIIDRVITQFPGHKVVVLAGGVTFEAMGYGQLVRLLDHLLEPETASPAAAPSL